MGELAKLIVDLRNGSVSIEAPSDVVTTVLEHLETLLPKLIEHATRGPSNSAQRDSGGGGLSNSEEEAVRPAAVQEVEVARAKRRRTLSRSRGVRPEGFDRLLKEPCKGAESYARAIAVADNLDRALLVLQLASTQFGISGLTPKEIVTVLIERFRQKAVRQSVQSALDRSVKKGLVHKEGPRYKLLAPGLKHVTELFEKVPIGPDS